MFFLTIVFSIITSVKDPGIIPRYPLLKALNDGVLPEKYTKPVADPEINQAENDRKF